MSAVGTSTGRCFLRRLRRVTLFTSNDMRLALLTGLNDFSSGVGETVVGTDGNLDGREPGCVGVTVSPIRRALRSGALVCLLKSLK